MKRLWIKHLLYGFQVLFYFVGWMSATNAEEEAIRGLLGRIAPGHAGDFILETIPSKPGENVFEVGVRDGKILLRGDSTISQAVALNWYLKHVALTDVSWYADDAVRVPTKFPLPSGEIHRTTRMGKRFFLNYCTFGYTMPFWHWRDWERCIDWMALNGVNLPLAQTGNEYIWQKVWKEYGLSDSEIRSFFTGPAYLPWHRMVNIDGWDGPLPQSFIDGQRDLQKKILERERGLGMSPVLCAFSGHVPGALKIKLPEVKIDRIPHAWCHFPVEYGCWFLDPLEPKFKEIQIKFLMEQQKEYGTSHYYGTDPFNEITPPSWDPSYLAAVSKAIYGGMAKVDPDAVWLQMGWTFNLGRKKDWTDERLSAMINAVPPGRMVLIDYVCEENELFRNTDGFYGAPFIWDYLGNFGGNTHLVGPMNKINQRLTAVMDDPKLTNCVGVGATLEGFNNPVVYEMLFNRVWEGPSLDLSEWVRDESIARTSGHDTNAEAAWGVIAKDVLVDNTIAIHGHGNVFQMFDPDLHATNAGKLSFKTDYCNRDLITAWEKFLQADPSVRKSSSYERDLVDTTRQALGNIALTMRDKLAADYDKKDADGFQRDAGRFLELGMELDKFLGTRTEFLLGKWIDDAKSWGGDKSEQAYYEKDARSILTIWGGGHLIDYAGRQWNGLMRDYYLPRWRSLLAATLRELKGGKHVDHEELERQWREMETKFARNTGGHYAATPGGDYFRMSRELFKKYVPIPESPHANDAVEK